MSEPHCFARLTPGEYLISVEPAPGTQPTSDERWSVALDQGTHGDGEFWQPRVTSTKPKAATGAEGAIGLVLAAAGAGRIGRLVIYRQRRGAQ